MWLGPSSKYFPRCTRPSRRRVQCRHLLDITNRELLLLRARFAALWHKSDVCRRRWCESNALGDIRMAPCSTCGDARLRRGDDALVCLHCGFVGCWSPFLTHNQCESESSGKHGQLHLATGGTHWLAVHVDRLELYCSHCGDFVGDARFQKLCPPLVDLS